MVFSGYSFNRILKAIGLYLQKTNRKELVPKVEELKEFCHQILVPLHLAVFYFTGTFYRLSNRVFGLRHLMIRKLQGGEDGSGYEILGLLVLIQVFVKAFVGPVQVGDYQEKHEPLENCPDNQKCALCLEKRMHTTATSCGHIFCWACIADWCRTKPECPICRQSIQSNRLYPILNY